MTTKTGLAAATALLLFTACGQSPKEELLNQITGIPEGKARLFSGDYRSGCEKITFNGRTLYQKDSIVFSGFDVGSVSDWNSGNTYPTVTTNTFSNESVLYTDSFCMQALATQSARGKFQLGSENKELALEASSLTLKPKHADMASALNAQAFCGYSNWATDTSRDLLAGQCGTSLKTARYFVNSHDADARVIDLIACLDEELKNCQKVTYLRQ